MEQQVLELVEASRSGDQPTRTAAELQLSGLYSNDAFPVALVTIGAHNEVTTANRQAALISLKLWVGKCWSVGVEEYEGNVQLSAELKDQIRGRLLAIAFDGTSDSKVINQAAAIISQIARTDFPEEWPNLLDLLLGQHHGNDSQAEAALIVLSELIQGGLDEDQFYSLSHTIVKFLHDIAVDPNKKTAVRALAVSVFRSCFDFVESLKDRDEYDIKGLTVAVCNVWSQFFLDVVKADLPPMPSAKEEKDVELPEVVNYRGMLALKVQVFVVLEKIQFIYPDILQCVELFTATWTTLQADGGAYYASYVDGNKESNLVAANGLSQSLDLLVIEELDFMQLLLDTPSVTQQLNTLIQGEGNSVAGWVTAVMGSLVTFSAITAEMQGLWDIDLNVFLAEDAFTEINSTPRTACATFIQKLCACFPQDVLNSILGYMKLIWEDPHPSWRHKEAALYMLQQIVTEHQEEQRVVAHEVAETCVGYIASTMTEIGHFLRARGHIVMASAAKAWLAHKPELIARYAQQSLKAMEEDDSDVVKAACISLMAQYLLALPLPIAAEMQVPVVNATAAFLEKQDFDDADDNIELVDATLMTLRDLIMASPETCLHHNALGLMLAMVKLGAGREENTSVLIEEGFESAAQGMAYLGPEAYQEFCEKILPPILETMDCGNDSTEQKGASMEVALNLIKVIAENARFPLPTGYVDATMPRICRIIMSDADFYLHQQATLCLKELLSNDHARVFAWVDPEYQKGGLEMLLLVIGHLLGPQVDDASAAEVGDLAVEVVEKAGPEALGSVMRELLQVVAVRLSTAEHLGLVQSLAMVFARLSLINAQDVINFLAEIQVGQVTALEVVVRKWLENTVHFAGFDAIRQNIRALIAIYGLHDARFNSVQVKGDEIFRATTSRIRTRSMAKAQPIEHEIISAEMKLIKLLVNELSPANTAQGIALAIKVPQTTRAGSDDSWETSGGNTPNFSPSRNDAETQKALVEFFTSNGADPHFQELYGRLTQDEQNRLMTAVGEHHAMEAQRAQLAGQ